MSQEEAPLEDLDRNKGWIMDSEGMGSDELSLGPVEDGLYFKGKEKGLFLLSKTEGEKECKKSDSASR
jgi:hypothetical protein